MVADDSLQWANGSRPRSLCSLPCGPTEQKTFQQNGCCWSCDPCAAHEYLNLVSGEPRCYACAAGTWPEAPARRRCLALTAAYVRASQPLGAGLLLAATCGLAACCLVSVLYVRHSTHALIKACSRQLSVVMMVGVAASYGLVLAFLVRPTDAVCVVKLTGLTLSVTVTYAPLATKTLRVLRIFESSRRMERRPACVSTSSQLLVTFALIVLHVRIAAYTCTR